MTRINAGIPPKQLVDKHLLAEIRELPRILNAVKTNKAKVNNIPTNFRLKQGHVTFFYNKLQYLTKRHKKLIVEAKARGFNVTSYTESYKQLPLCLFNDWQPTTQDKQIVAERIIERLHTMQHIKHRRKSISLNKANNLS